MRRFFELALTTLSVCAALPAATLLSENFDALTPALSVTSAGAFSTTGRTDVDIVGGALFGSLCASPESGNCVDMDGSTGNPQGILQSNSSFLLMPGVSYLLSFDLIGSGRGNTTSTTVDFGPYSQSFVLASGDRTSGIVSNALVTVSSPTSVHLTFTSNTPGVEGALLDNVTIASSGTSTPEPSAGWLVAGGLAALGLLRRRRAGPPAGQFFSPVANTVSK